MPGSQAARLDVFKHVASAAPEGLLHLGIEMDSASPCHSPSSVPGPGDKKMNKSKQAKQIQNAEKVFLFYPRCAMQGRS